MGAKFDAMAVKHEGEEKVLIAVQEVTSSRGEEHHR
jgi:hypothetical protein